MRPPELFDETFRAALRELLELRRDVRSFRSDPIPDETIAELVEETRFSPSVGYSQPWRFVKVDSAQRRDAVVESFRRANAAALSSYSGERASLYATLKLSGLLEAPVHVAVFCDAGTTTGNGLGAMTMPQTLEYSTVMAIYTFWLVARARGIGVGWVSIVEPHVVEHALDVPADWRLVAYLCVGYPVTHEKTPELQRFGWENLDARSLQITQR